MASPYGHYAEILEDILKELQKGKRKKEENEEGKKEREEKTLQIGFTIE